MPAVSTWNVVVILFDTLNIIEPISQTCRTCYYHLRDFQCIRRYLPLSIVSALFTRRLHY